MAEFFVYILKSEKSGRHYIGSSSDPDKRLKRHNTNGVVSTRNKGPWKIVFTQEFKTNVEARQIENKHKKLKRKDIIDRIISDGYIKMKTFGV